MARSKRQKKIAWIKMPVNLTDDERIAELMSQRGVSGLGVYVAVIDEMYRRQCRCLTMTQIRALKFAGATQKTIMAVVDEFSLFRRDKMGHVYSAIDYLGFDDEYECPPDDNPSANEFESPLFPSPARVYSKDVDEDKDHHNDGADFIAQIPENSEWTEITLMKSGFGQLIRRNWQLTLDLFREHAIANCNTGKICSVEEAKKYFLFYVTNSVTGPKLRKALEDHERLHPADNPYLYEDAGSAPGHRSYHGIPLPDTAPPRPDERSDWDWEGCCWISPADINQNSNQDDRRI